MNFDICNISWLLLVNRRYWCKTFYGREMDHRDWSWWVPMTPVPSATPRASKLTNSRLRHQMEIYSALPALCEGNPAVIGVFPSQRPVTRSFNIFFDLRPNKRLSKQSRGRWFETPLRSLWRHCNDKPISHASEFSRDLVLSRLTT